MLDYFNEQKTLPEAWQSLPDKAKRAYWAILELRERRIEYINSHSKKNDFRSAKHYLIASKSEIADTIGVTPQALSSTNTVSYAKQIDDLIEATNKELRELVQNKLSKKSVTTRVLVKQKGDAEDKIKHLQSMNAKEQVKEIISRLHLPVRKKLFME